MPRYGAIMTREGHDAIKSEHDKLVSQRPELVNNLSQASEMGDRSENAAYSNAKRRLRQTDSRIRFLKRILDFTKVVKPTQTDVVDIGSFVLLKLNGNIFTFQVVGLHEAQPDQGKISYRSPVGSALLGKRIGDIAKITLPDREIEYEIIKITI